jgi:spermidine synthase
MQFPKMVEILPPGKSGDAEITHFTVSKAASDMTALRAFQHPGAYVQPGDYARLVVGRTLMMTDTQNEKRTNFEVVYQAKGHVFIAGLGIGMILHPIAAKPEVIKITVLEKSQGVIDLVAKTLPAKVGVVQGDIFEYKPEKGTKFDCIYFDIWPFITPDNLPEMATLHRRFARCKTQGGWMDSWCRAHLKSQKRRKGW